MCRNTEICADRFCFQLHLCIIWEKSTEIKTHQHSLVLDPLKTHLRGQQPLLLSPGIVEVRPKATLKSLAQAPHATNAKQQASSSPYMDVGIDKEISSDL